jgi:hypothetical protein
MIAQMRAFVTTGHATARPGTRGSTAQEGLAPTTAAAMVTVSDPTVFVKWAGQVSIAR